MINWKRIGLKEYELPMAIGYDAEYIGHNGLPRGVELNRIGDIRNEYI
ncbi:MAG: hypothetical protein GX329_00555, partial [Tissierellia bacterium]|nr:hypothetical protein [Tissierellia bacterium]